MEKNTSSRAGMAKKAGEERSLRKSGSDGKQTPVKGVGKLSDSPRAKKLLARKEGQQGQG